MTEPTRRTRRALIAGLAAALALAAWTPAASAQAQRTPATSAITVATVEWIEQFDPGVLASGPGLNYKGSMFDNVIGAGPGGTLSKSTGVVEDWTGLRRRHPRGAAAPQPAHGPPRRRARRAGG
jgi:hypothetical protein